MKTDVIIRLMTVEETEQQNRGEAVGEKKEKGWRRKINFSIYAQILANTCPEGPFKHLKIENHAALGSPPHPPETGSQTAVVIGSERFFFFILIFSFSMHLHF